MMKKSKVRIGVIGIGVYSAGAHVPAIRELTEEAELVAICRRNVERLKMAKNALGVGAAYTDFREMLGKETLDAVVVSTSNNMHAEPTIAALNQGLHVLVEKPLALKSEDAYAMVEAARLSKRILTVGYNCRFTPSWRAAKEALTDGNIGVIRQAVLRYCIDTRPFWNKAESIVAPIHENAKSGEMKAVFFADNLNADHWRNRSDERGPGFFVEVGTHAVDAMLWLTGGKTSVVVALTENGGLPVDGYVTAQGKLTNGALFSIAFSEATSGDGSFVGQGSGDLTVHGDDGFLAARWQGWNPSRATITIARKGEPKEIIGKDDDITPVGAFVGTIIGDSVNFAPGEECVGPVILTEAIFRSAAENRIVTV